MANTSNLFLQPLPLPRKELLLKMASTVICGFLCCVNALMRER